ncbi:Os11g0639700 [Oryza sativa Japonica Group]|uniref:Os11g0639700 protein n=3 Tax=Oryza TaxID=4527 RepID=Q2R0M7_ORYSJ|nr:hypothetical protein LOC_Os11g42050 [Oryza sativa Japonica Group]BAT15000.1 Os11g0639700 [Oryza sativa Japonica Group]
MAGRADGDAGGAGGRMRAAPPYGIDFLTHMPALPYLSPDLRGENLLVCANFASAGVSILNDTGIQFLAMRLELEEEVGDEHDDAAGTRQVEGGVAGDDGVLAGGDAYLSMTA